ncbi:PAS domain S-box protein [Plastoroseomonas arctica]|uniref:histidine kinase n=1 Tax=Plastoroseomonas arctica TaxID=1509237 RepID=A0AAF1JY91_9PROT|nr:PAS domain S-box protein [Plastoroseomonas arctica]MBR0656672.1 PAS domain S-box protein [Plastoroseomonas arctica]
MPDKDLKTEQAPDGLLHSGDSSELLIASIAEILFQADAAGELIGELPLWRAFSGQSPKDWASQGWAEAVHDEDRAGAIAGWRAAVRTQRLYQDEYRFLRVDGAWRLMRVTATPVRDGAGAFVKWIGMITDITDSRAAQRELLETKRRFELALANSPVTLFEQDMNLRYSWIHNALGYARPDIIGQSEADIMDPAAAERLEALKRRVIETGLACREEVVAHAPGKPEQHFDLCVEPRRNEAGAIVGVLCAAVNITGQKQAQAALQASEERLRILFEQSVAGIFVADGVGQCVDANPAGCRMLGLTLDEVLGNSFENLLAADEPSRFLAELNSQTDGSAHTSEWRFRRRDGSTFLGEVIGRRMADGRHQLILRVMAEPSNAEQTLRTAQDTFRKLVDRSPFGIFEIDHAFRIIQVSDGAQKTFETIHPLIGRDLGEVLRLLWTQPFADDATARFRHTLATGEPHAAQNSERRAASALVETYDWRIDRIVMPDGEPGVVCHFYDLTDRNKHEGRVQLLMQELNHRAKNMLQLVDIVARRTAATRPEDFVERFGQRIQSLAANQNLLVESQWRAVPFAELIRSQLAHFGDLLDTRITVSGPAIDITAAPSQTLAMALHELATNAAKYGALSNDKGQVAITWDVTADPGTGPRFTLDWVETGGPPVSSPTQAGFGSTVLRQLVEMSFGGTATLEFAPDGFAWRLDCPAGAILDGTPRTALAS